MSYHNVHALLDSQEFPFNFRELSNTVIANMPLDQDRGIPQAFTGSEGIKNAGYCHAYFLENVFPISRGYKSVSFLERIPVIPGLSSAIVNSFIINGPGGKLALFVATVSEGYVYDPAVGTWQSIAFSATSTTDVTYAVVRETTYIHFGYAIFTYNFNSQSFEQVELIGIAGAGATRGVASAGAYLILWDDSFVYYSSVFDALDFTPSIATGAGSSGVLPLKGRITSCVALGQDFVIYSTVNAVSARQTGNMAFPFVYKEIDGSVGAQKLQYIAYNSNVGSHIVWTQSGFQNLSLDSASYIWPELSDGIIQRTQLRYDPWLGIIDQQQVAFIDVTVRFCSNRYICISTKGEEDYNFDCYVYDISLQRWGKLSIPHAMMFELNLPQTLGTVTYQDVKDQFGTYGGIISQNLSYRGVAPGQTEAVSLPGRNLAVLDNTGKVYEISLSEDWQNNSQIPVPKIILGRYKVTREEGVVLQYVKINDRKSAKMIAHSHSYIGTVFQLSDEFIGKKEQPGQYFNMVSGDSISLELQGEFKLTELTLVFANAGSMHQLRDVLNNLLVITTQPFELPPAILCESNFFGPDYWDTHVSEIGPEGYWEEETNTLHLATVIRNSVPAINSGWTWGYRPAQLLLTIEAPKAPAGEGPFNTADINQLFPLGVEAVLTAFNTTIIIGSSYGVFNSSTQEIAILMDLNFTTQDLARLYLISDLYSSTIGITCMQFLDEPIGEAGPYNVVSLPLQTGFTVDGYTWFTTSGWPGPRWSRAVGADLLPVVTMVATQTFDLNGVEFIHLRVIPWYAGNNGTVPCNITITTTTGVYTTAAVLLVSVVLIPTPGITGSLVSISFDISNYTPNVETPNLSIFAVKLVSPA